MKVARTVTEVRAALRELPRPLGFVPTMGSLHGGHLALVQSSRAANATTATSLFVNPAQFSAGEDYERYPRDEARDLARFEEAGVDVVFAPAADEMYPAGACATVHVAGPLAESFEGAARPGHFDGVATVVVKLLHIVLPSVLYLGEKDAQQLAVLRRVVRDLDLPVEVAGVPTVREPDGLAMSSRNAHLTAGQRAVAPDLYRALMAGATRAADGPKEVIATAAMHLVAPEAGLLTEEDRLAALKGQAAPQPPRFHVEYLAVVHADTFAQQSTIGPRSLLVAAATLGATRLIDNVPLETSAYPVAGDATE